MNYRVKNFYEQNRKNLRLLAGESGLDRVITSAGILDCDFIPMIRGYSGRRHFKQGQLVMSTFLYARDDPLWIAVAVGRLEASRCSGLVINNLFELPIPKIVLEECDRNNFPLFATRTKNVDMAEFIGDVIENVDFYRKSEQQEKLIAGIFNATDSATRERILLKLYPNLQPSYRCLFLDRKVEFSFEGDAAFSWMYGMILVVSESGEGKIAEIREEIGKADGECRCGVSAVHFSYGECDQAMREAEFAVRILKRKISRFEECGLLRALVDAERSPQMSEFARSLLETVKLNDYENGEHLAETLQAWIDQNCSIEDTAYVLKVHKNTVRNRLEKISMLTGLDYRNAREASELIMAQSIDHVISSAGRR